MEGCVEQPLAPALSALAVAVAVAGILCDVGDQAGIENALALGGGIKTAVEIDIGASEVQLNLFGHLFQRFETLRQQGHVRFVHGSNRDGC